MEWEGARGEESAGPGQEDKMGGGEYHHANRNMIRLESSFLIVSDESLLSS